MMSIPVKNIQELYAAITDTKNLGQTLKLAAGTYTLNETIDTVNAGRLELLKDMKLEGQDNHPELVIIDASKLPEASFGPSSGFPNRTGAIRMGLGFSQLEWITVLGSKTEKALSIIDTDLIWNGVSHVRIANCNVSGGRIGINIRNVGQQSNQRNIVAELENNVLHHNRVSQPRTQQGQGLVVQHANGVSNGSISVTMSGNRFNHNIIGMKIFNNSNSTTLNTINNTIQIESNGDHFEENGLGLYMQGGTNPDPNTTTAGNSISFVAHGTKFRNNQGILPDPLVLPCGIFLTGGTKSATGHETSNNRIDIKLAGCPMSGNQDFDLIAFGAFRITEDPPGKAIPPPTDMPGHHNMVKIELAGVSKKAIRIKSDCFPPEPGGTNEVLIIG